MKKFKAKNLQELMDEVNKLESEVIDYDYPINDPQGHYDATSLPTFGGEEPKNTLGVYSWDATHIMWYDADGAFSKYRIIPKEDWFYDLDEENEIDQSTYTY